MSDGRDRLDRGVRALRGRAVRVPLRDDEAERAHHENMDRIADGHARFAGLLADPDTPPEAAVAYLVEEMAAGFEHRLERLVGEHYNDVAVAYAAGERDDWIGELAAYYRECVLRLQEHTTVADRTCRLLLLRYPDCLTVNFSFADGALPDGGVRFESPAHAGVDYDDAYAERYYAESQYAQREAAAYLRETADVVREQFPDPETTPFAERRYGGFVYLTGRRDEVFATALDAVEPDPDRFDDACVEPGLVPAGPEADRVDRDYLAEADVVA